MDMMDMPHGTPWLDMPIMFHSSREYHCKFNQTELCEYQQGYWRFWYQADYRYALPTIALFLVGIILFAIPFAITSIAPGVASSTSLTRRVAALNRYLSYRQYRIASLKWNSAPLGVLLLAAVGVIFFFAMVLGPRPYYWPNTATIGFGDSPPLATRSGWLATGCMPFVIALSSKSNLITAVTGVSHERLQTFHRWISYAMFVLALLHTFPFIVYNINMGTMVETWNTSVFYWTGVVALLAQAYLTFASASPLRNWCYEWFKFSHFSAALIFMLFFFFHCDFTLTSVDYFIAAGVIYTLTWLHSQLRIYFEHGINKKATISLMSNGFIRVSLPTKSTWRVGQHYFVRFLSPALGLHALSSHPFSVCSLPTKSHYYEAKESELVFFIRPQGGFTTRLAKLAEKRPNGKMRVSLDGPYGGIDMNKLATAQNILVVAGGSGAGWVLPLIEAFLRRKDCVACCEPTRDDKLMTGDDCDMPTMRVVLATRDLATRNWFEEAIVEMLSTSLIGICPPGLQVEVHYTGGAENANAPKATGQFSHKLDDPEKLPTSNIDIRAGDSTADSDSDNLKNDGGRFALSLRDLTGRPDTPALVAEQVSSHPGKSTAVFLCGPSSMQADVANAVAYQQLPGIRDGRRDIYLHMEHFSWS